LIGVESKIVKRAEANRIGVLILRKRFRAPRYGTGRLNSPRCAAVASISLSAIMCPARMLNWRMKSDVRDVYSWSNRYAEGLNPTIKILVVKSVFIVPDASRWVGYFVTHEPDTIDEVIGFELVYRRTGPSRDRRMLPHGGSRASKIKRLINSGYGVGAVRSVVIHVALVRMTLAPRAFVGDDVFRFGKVCRSRV
jgi:hypothetical protein